MAKVIKGVVAVIGAVASVLAVIPSPIQPIAAIVAAGAAVASAALNIMLPAKPRSPALSGTQTAFRLDPQAGIPYVIGRTLVGGLGIHRDTWGTDNQYHGIVVAWSGGGPVEAIEQFQVDTVPTNFAGGGAAVGGFAGFMWLATQLGATPSGALASPVAGFPGWGANQKLSGYAAGIWVCMFDKKGKKFAAGLPKIAAVIRGPKCYDPRLDSTYPGGAGPCRVGDQATYVPSENPWIQAINWALGRWANGQKVLGVGMGVGSIVMASFVSAANVADANNWKAGGVVSSVDDKWEVIKMLSQAGGGECVRLGGKLSAFVNAPRVSIATIETGDLVGDAKIATTQFIRSRVNAVVPVMRLESHGWEQVPGAPVRFDPYVVEDGGRRTVETEFVLVQQLKQGAELAAYEVVNAREFGPIDLQLKLRWLGIEPGDLVTLNIPSAGLAGQKCLALARSLDPTSANVALSLRSETDAKHALALGKTTTVPPSPSLTPIDLSIVPAPGALAWTVLPAVITGPDGGQFPILRARGATDNPTASNVVFEYRPVAVPVGAMPGAPVIGQAAIDANGAQFVWEAPGVWARVWIMQATQDAGVTEQEFPSVTPLTQYQIAVSYVSRGVLGARRVLGPVTTAENIGTGRLWIQTNAPAREESAAGDIWIDDTGFYWVRREEVYLSIAGDRLMIGGDLLTITWTPADSQPIRDAVTDALSIALAASDAAAALALDAQATADGKVQSFYQIAPPVAEGVGDLWFDTDDGNKQYRWSGSAWVGVQDTGIGNALTAAAGAQATADGKVTTFYATSAPVAEGVGDLWYNSVTGYLKRWNGSAWVDVANVGATAAQIADIGTALTDAANAQAIADGKVDTFYQAAPPGGGTIGDLWFDTDDANKLYRHSGAGWVLARDSGIGAAITAAAGAQATADGKVTTFVNEAAPGAVATGDLWFKASTGELRRWSGAAWGNPLVDLTSAAQIVVVPPATYTIYRNSDGSVKPGQLPGSLRPLVTRGGVDRRTDNAMTYSVVGTGNLVGKVSVDNVGGSATKGDVTLANTITADGTFQLTVAFSGVNVGTFVTQVVTSDDAPPVNNGTSGGTDSSLAVINSTAYAVMSGLDGGDPVMDVVLTGGQTLKLNTNFYYRNTSGTPLTMTCKGQYSSDGVTWHDMNTGTTEQTGTAAQKLLDPVEYSQGSAVFAFTKGGLAAGTWKVRLMGKLTSGAGTLTPTTGGATSSRS